MSKTKYKGKFVSRGGEKLEHALREFNISVEGLVCADFGSSTGGFTDCLLQHGAAKVYSVDTGYGVLDYKLRTDPRVVVMERTNAMHVVIPEKVDLVTIDTSWTKQKNILKNAIANLKPEGMIISLIKPHYEAGGAELEAGKLDDEVAIGVVADLLGKIETLGLKVNGVPIESPIRGGRAGNMEYLITAIHSSYQQ
ncbi:MAG: SAM-dependent methyltransferase [Candidatus Dojkabacteria bacterium]|nr:MAG: SAM-dependent methyltransferase [Candidatus Dojkabacteria bacterium]